MITSSLRRGRVFFFFLATGGVAIALFGCGGKKSGGTTTLTAPTSDRTAAYYYNNLGVALMEQGMAKTEAMYYREAAKEFQTALAVYPDYVNARVNLGTTYYFAGGKSQAEDREFTAKAKAQFEEVLKRDPDNPHAHFMLGLILQKSEKSASEAKQLNEQAAEHFRAVLKRDPNDAYSQFFLGAVLSQLGQYKEAVAPLRQAVKSNPGNTEIRYRFFQTLLRAGESEEARKEQEAFQALFRAKKPSAEKNLDKMYARRGKYSEGIIETTILPVKSQPPKDIAFEDATRLAQVKQEPPPLNFKHQGAAMDPEVAKAWRGEPMPKDWFVKNKVKFVTAFGSGVAVGDYDNDGNPDIYLVNAAEQQGSGFWVLGSGESHPKPKTQNLKPGHALFHNNGGTFTNVTTKAGVGGNGKPGMAAVWGDYDNDGFLDLLVTIYGGVILYHNNGNSTFSDVTRAAGLGNVPPDTWCMGAAFSDVDHDGDLDVFVCNYADLTHLPDKPMLQFPDDFQGQPNFLFRNNTADRYVKESAGNRAPTAFTEIAAESKVDGGRSKHLGVVFSDFDNDNAVDFLLVNDGEPNVVYVNRRDRTFEAKPIALSPNPSRNGEGRNARTGGVAVADVNYDGNMDVFIVNGENGTPSLLLGAGDGTFKRLDVETLQRSGGRITGVGFFDVENDGFPDLFIARSSAPGQPPAHPVLLHNENGKFRDVSDEVQVKVNEQLPTGGADKRYVKLSDYAAKAARGLACGDFNGDGKADLVIVNNGDYPTYLTAGSVDPSAQEGSSPKPPQPRNYLKVKAMGFSPPSNLLQSNHQGVGAKVEVRAPGLWQRQEITAGSGYLSCNGSELLFGLGERMRVDFVRAIFSSGVRAAQISFANSALTLKEPQGEIPSCPYLYAWNGRRFEFISDVLAAGTIGELVSPNDYLSLPPFEPVKISGEQLQPKNGAYLFSLVNQLPEVDYIEQARLMVVDHPADVEVYPDNRLTEHPRTPPSDPRDLIWVVRDTRLPVAATDDAGRDVLSLIAHKDRRYHADLKPLPWRGFAQRHSLTLDFGNLEGYGLWVMGYGAKDSPKPKTQNLKPVLLLHGYISWGGSSTALGAGQAGVFYECPKLEVRDERGRWKVVDADMGIPAGHPRTIVVPLELGNWEIGKLGNENVQVRITTNMMIYWDEARIGFAERNSQHAINTHEARLTNVELRFLGYPQPYSPDGRKPDLYDYDRRAAFKDMPSLTGAFTRYGDATPLLRERDDLLAVMNHGDEVRMSFDARAMSALPSGWKRDYVLLLWGYGKSADVNTAHSLTVEPLPFAAMSRYPYPPTERYPTDEKRLRYLLEYNTRW